MSADTKLSDAELAACLLSVPDPLMWGKLGAEGADMLRTAMREVERVAVAAERERWTVPAEMAVQELAHCATWTAGGVACKALRDVLRAER